MRNTLLMYNIAPDKLTKLRVLCMRLGIKMRPVEKSEYGLELEKLLGEKSECQYDGDTFDDEMVVMCGCNNRTVDEFLMGMRTNRISVVALKAMMTQTNAKWSSFQLHSELCAERDALKAGKKAHETK